MKNCIICRKNNGTINTFIGVICTDCDKRTDKMAEEKIKTFNLPRFDDERKPI
jgi:hypothetical protein